MVLFGTNLDSNISTKALKKAPYLMANLHFFGNVKIYTEKSCRLFCDDNIIINPKIKRFFFFFYHKSLQPLFDILNL